MNNQTFTRRKGLRMYREIQGQRMDEAWRRPEFHEMTRVNVNRRRDDNIEPTWPQYLAMLTFSIASTWCVWIFAVRVIPMIRGWLA